MEDSSAATPAYRPEAETKSCVCKLVLVGTKARQPPDAPNDGFLSKNGSRYPFYEGPYKTVRDQTKAG